MLRVAFSLPWRFARIGQQGQPSTGLLGRTTFSQCLDQPERSANFVQSHAVAPGRLDGVLPSALDGPPIAATFEDFGTGAKNDGLFETISPTAAAASSMISVASAI